MMYYVVILLILASVSVSHQHEACSDARAASIKFTVRSSRNQTGHWITKVKVDNSQDSGVADSEGTHHTGQWTLDVDQSSAECDGTDAMSLQATITAPPPRAGPGYELFPRIGYYKLHTIGQTWKDARATCVKEGAHLAIINSEAESDVLKNMLNLHPSNTLKNTHNEYAYLGFSDIYQEGHFVTVFGEPLNATGFTRWAGPGQPDNAGASATNPGEDCGSIYRNGGLNDIPCDWKLAFFCEQELF